MKRSGIRRLYMLSVLLIVAAAMSATSPAPSFAAARPESTPLTPAPAWFSCVHVVRSGETFFTIALLHGTSPFVLASMNGMSSFGFLFVGVVLRVPCVIAFQSPLVQPVISQPQAFPRICDIHIVQRGEWLRLIAARFGVAWQTIAMVNRLVNPNLIFPGERLLIPCPSGANPSMNQMPAQTPSVTIQDFMFSPAMIMVRVGQTVMWRNNGPSMHTTTSDTAAWNSGALGMGSTFSHTFNSAGTFAYHCAIHPLMHGTVVVTQ